VAISDDMRNKLQLIMHAAKHQQLGTLEVKNRYTGDLATALVVRFDDKNDEQFRLMPLGILEPDQEAFMRMWAPPMEYDNGQDTDGDPTPSDESTGAGDESTQGANA
jgi:hypothetical protein